MTTRQKIILYNLILLKVMEQYQIPRGSGKSLAYFALSWRREAFRRTEFCLAAIGESLEGIAPEELYEN